MIALLVVPISADIATIPYDETVEVGAFSYYSITFEDLEEEMTLSISLEVVKGNDITFFICRKDQFRNWERGATISREALTEDVVSASIEWTVPVIAAGWERYLPRHWTFVLDNRDSGEKVTVHLTIVEATRGWCLGTLLIAAIPIVALVILGKRKIFS